MNQLLYTIVLLLTHFSIITAQTTVSSSQSYHLVKNAGRIDDGVYLIGGYQDDKYLYLMNTVNMDSENGKMLLNASS